MDMDNRFWPYGCPAKMADGRFTTNYQNPRVFNEKIREINNIKTSCEFRKFLQNNGGKLMDNENKYLNNCWMCQVRCCGQTPMSCNKDGCKERKPCIKDCPQGSVLDGYKKFTDEENKCHK